MKRSAAKTHQKKKQRKFKHSKPAAVLPPKESSPQDSEKSQEKEEAAKRKLKFSISFPKFRLKLIKGKGSSHKEKNAFQLFLSRHDSDVQLILFPLILL